MKGYFRDFKKHFMDLKSLDYVFVGFLLLSELGGLLAGLSLPD